MKKSAMQAPAILAVILIVWFIIPLISIDHVQLLPSISDRSIVIFLILAGWGSYFLWQNKEKLSFTGVNPFLNRLAPWATAKKSPVLTDITEMSAGPHAEANLTLTRHFQIVRDYCRKTGGNKKRPVYILLGNQHSGKSSLLKYSGLELKTIPAIHPQNSRTTDHDDINGDDADEARHCHWHIHENCIFIDTPGEFATSEITDNLQTPWRTLLGLLMRKYSTFPIKGVIITLSMQELLSASKQNTRIHMHLLKQRILDLKKYYGEQLPVSIMFTKWDSVVGFQEFFDNMDAQDRQQIFAIRMNTAAAETTIPGQFKLQYELLLQQMSRLLITRMHDGHNYQKRTRISQFPLQMEQMQGIFTSIISNLLEKPHNCDAAIPDSIYFTSAEQHPETINVLSQKLQSSFNLPATFSISDRHLLNNHFFIQGIFNNLANSKELPVTELTVSRRGQYAIYGMAVLIIVGFTSLMLIKFSQSVKSINTAEANTYALSMLSSSIKNADASRNAALQLAQQVDSSSHFWLGKKITANDASPIPAANPVPSPETGAASAPAPAPEIHQSTPGDLTAGMQTILSNAQTDPAVLYNTLKAYLMLSNNIPVNYGWLHLWLQDYAVKKRLIDSAQAASILSEVQKKQTVVQTQQGIIDSTRKQLTGLPAEYLAYIILQDQADYSGTRPLKIIIATRHVSVPFIFTAQGLQTLFLNSVQQAAQDALTGNAVLGTLQNHAAVADIENQLVSMYATNYVNWWTRVFNGFQIPQFSNLQSLINFMGLLNSPDRGLVNAYQTVLQNTNINNLLPDSVSNPLINNLRQAISQQAQTTLSSLYQLKLDQLQSGLNQFEQFLGNLASTGNIQETAFFVLKNQFENPDQNNILAGFNNFAASLPEPLKTNLTDLASQSAQLLSQAAALYLQNIWNVQVISYYDRFIAHRYPLFKSAVQDINPGAFMHFFSPNGLLNSFFNNNLAMFIDTSQSTWQLKNINGVMLPLNDQLILSLEKGRIITAMFFPDNSPSMQVDFTLQQTAMMPIVRSFELNINGQSLFDQQGSRNISTFIWPGNSNFNTLMTFNNVNGQHVYTEHHGLWSWFHILDTNKMLMDGNSENYSVTFDIDGNEARYHLSADDLINPFIPGIINTFRIPKNIINSTG